MIDSASIIYKQTGKDRIQRFQFNGNDPEMVARAFVEIKLRGRDDVSDVRLIVCKSSSTTLDLSQTVCADIPETVRKMFGDTGEQH
jgi:hypothetical protein